jgi:hypothetical protein
MALGQRQAQYQATAQVGPTDKLQLPNLNPLPRLAESVFNNGYVETDLRAMLGQPTGNIIPSKVQLIAAQDNIVFDVVAHAPTAQQAILIANRAASTFAIQLNSYKLSVAPFVLVQKAILAKKVPKFGGGHTAIAFGVIAGLLAGVALVGLILVIRRPVVDASTAQEVTGSPVIGRVSLPRHGPPTKADSRAVGLLARRLLTTSASTVHVAAPSHGQAERLAALIGNVYDRMRAERRQQNRQSGKGGTTRLPTVVAPEDAETWTGTPEEESFTVLMVPTGISSRKLRRLAEWHDTAAPTGIVMVTAHRGHGTPTAH